MVQKELVGSWYISSHKRNVERLLLKLFGLRATILFCDTAHFDRWLWLRRHLHQGSLRTLDAGCGSGSLSFYAAHRGNEVIGISFQERNNEAARRRKKILGIGNARFITGDLRELHTMQDALGTFDQIICFETIEHIMNDKKLLRDFAALLCTGGQLLLTTPYKYYRRSPGEKISEVENGGHVRWGYTHGEMRKLLETTGMDVVLEEYLTGYISYHLIKLHRFFSSITNSRVALLLIFVFRPLVIFDRFVTRLLRYPYFTIAVVAKKLT